MRGMFLTLAFFIFPLQPLLAAPYENLAWALRVQTILQDLRVHCHVDANITDEMLKKQFVDKTVSHPPIILAAKALQAGKQEEYRQHITDVPCPDGPTAP
ncbi:MAG: YicS family protein [Pantoea sp.]|uniref:YicS family protein n=1 Tax=Pantoea sp. TaxID=69393 RepID=UPI0039E6425F